MSDGFSIEGGVLRVDDPAFFADWMYREDYVDALAASDTPEVTAAKRLVIEFEAALAKMLLEGKVEEEVDSILERFIVDDYVQHDPNVPGDGRDVLAETFRLLPFDGDPPPPPVSLIVEGDLVCLLMQKPLPDPTEPGATYDWFIPTIFRIRDGRLAEHWGAFKKGPPGFGPPTDLPGPPAAPDRP